MVQTALGCSSISRRLCTLVHGDRSSEPLSMDHDKTRTCGPRRFVRTHWRAGYGPNRDCVSGFDEHFDGTAASVIVTLDVYAQYIYLSIERESGAFLLKQLAVT